MSIPPLQCSTTGKLRPRENVSSPRDAEWMHMQNDAKWCNMMHNRNERIQKSNMTNIQYIHNTKIVWKNVSSGFRTPSLHFLIQPVACILGGIRQCCRVCLLLEGKRCQLSTWDLPNQIHEVQSVRWLKSQIVDASIYYETKTKTLGATRTSMCNRFFFTGDVTSQFSSNNS